MYTTEELITTIKEEFPDVDAVVSVYTLSIEWGSKQFLKQIGYSQEEVAELTVRDITTLAPAEISTLILKFIRANNEPFSQELICKDGTLCAFDMHVTMRKYHNELFAIYTNVKRAK